MARNETTSWMTVPGSIGQHLFKGRNIMAHAWIAHERGWMSLMSEAPDHNTPPPIHGPYETLDDAKKAAELGNGYHKIALAR